MRQDFDRVGRISLAAVGLTVVCLISWWPPAWVACGALIVAVLSGFFVGAALDVHEYRQELDFAMLRRRVMFGTRPLSAAQARKLHRLLSRYPVIRHESRPKELAA